MTSLDRRIGVVLAGATALSLALLGHAPAVADPGTILMYGPSVDGADPNEQTVAEAEGHTVTVVSDTEWAAMSTAQFAAFDALVVGDDGCNGDETQLDAVQNSRTTWSPAVTGNIVLSAFDPFAHNTGDSDQLVANSIGFAASTPGKTGLFFSLGCYFDSENEDSSTIPHLNQFGTFRVDPESGNTITILQPGHPVMAGLTNGGLSDWSSSTHEHFVSFPASFQALAEDSDADPPRPVLLAGTAPAAEVPPICKGKPATVFGGAAGEVLTGTPGKDVVAGLGGNDRIQAGGGKDLVCGGDGNDRLKGGAGKDTLLGQAGKDLLAGGGGNGDVCKGGPGKDTAKGNCEKGKA